MTEEDLKNIHQHLIQEVQNFGGRIDAIFMHHNWQKKIPF